MRSPDERCCAFLHKQFQATSICHCILLFCDRLMSILSGSLRLEFPPTICAHRCLKKSPGVSGREQKSLTHLEEFDVSINLR